MEQRPDKLESCVFHGDADSIPSSSLSTAVVGRVNIRRCDLAPMADALKDLGIATWNIEYRRLGNPGGGWPGAYQDVATAVDDLRTIALKTHST